MVDFILLGIGLDGAQDFDASHKRLNAQLIMLPASYVLLTSSPVLANMPNIEFRADAVRVTRRDIIAQAERHQPFISAYSSSHLFSAHGLVCLKIPRARILNS